MPVIQPRDITDCHNFIKQHKDEIMQDVYDIEIKPDWVRQLDHDELRLLAQKCRSSVQIIASSSNTPSNILDILSKDNDKIVRSTVAKNSNTPINILDILAKDSDPSVRCYVASNPNTAATTLNILAKDTNIAVQNGVASNTTTPTSTLDILASSSNYAVRESVANNRNASVNALDILSREKNLFRDRHDDSPEMYNLRVM